MNRNLELPKYVEEKVEDIVDTEVDTWLKGVTKRKAPDNSSGGDWSQLDKEAVKYMYAS